MKTLFAAEIAEPYAQALMSIAQSNNVTDRIGEDIDALLTLLHESQDFRTIITNPLIKPDTKKAIIRQVVGDQVHPFTLNFLMILVDKGRILFLEAVCQQFKVLLRQLNQTVLAEVTSAVPLSDEQAEAIRQKVLSVTQARQVELSTHIDPELIGGVVVKVGSQIFDASLRGQLRRIGARLTSAI